MVSLSELRPGIKVKIVDHWVPGCGENPEGRMDHWLGKIVTVQEVFDNFIDIEEDQGEFLRRGWMWFPAAIDHIVHGEEPLPTDEDFQPAPEDAFQSLFF